MAELTLPYDLDLEAAVLGAMLLESDAAHQVLPILQKDDFYSQQNAEVFQAIRSLAAANEVIDLLTVSEKLKTTKKLDFVGGAYYVSNLTSRIASSANVEFHARILSQKSIGRKTFKILTQALGLIHEPTTDFIELPERLITALSNLTNDLGNSRTARTIGDFAQDLLTDLKVSMENPQSQNVPVRNNILSSLTNGFKPSHLIVIGARPGQGKTAAVLEFVEYPASIGFPTALFSVEMRGIELAGRSLSKHSHVDGMRITNRSVSGDELQALENVRELDGIPLYIDDSPSLSLVQLRAKAMRLKRMHNIQMLAVDYLQLMDGDGSRDTREQEVSKISRGLKRLAKELEIPVIALCQLNRQSEVRTSNKPQLSDLRDSGAIEQDADMVILLHRPEKYGHKEYEIDGQKLPAKDLLIMDVCKNRGGITGEIPCSWIGSRTSIEDYRI